MQFTLLSTKTQSKAPYCLGYAFRRGDIPAGSSVGASISGLQVISRTTWPDGSLKFAQLAGVVDVSAGSMLVVRLHRINAPAASTPLGVADLKKTGVTAEFGAGTLGTASFGATDWDVPFQTWASGPQMSSWIFRKPVGSDAHLVAWLEVRLFAGGAVEVLPWIENGYLQVAGPTNKSATYTFKLGNTERFSAAIDLPHHCRTPLINGTALSYWLADDPGVTPRHDLAYLQATELVPTYSGRVAATAAVAQGLVTSFSPLTRANLVYESDYMPATGYQEPIGLLPQHDVLYLTCDSSNTYAAVVRNGFAAGRYPLHYRDEKTQRPIRFSQYPNLVLHGDSRVSDVGGSTRSHYTPKPAGTASPKMGLRPQPFSGLHGLPADRTLVFHGAGAVRGHAGLPDQGRRAQYASRRPGTGAALLRRLANAVLCLAVAHFDPGAHCDAGQRHCPASGVHQLRPVQHRELARHLRGATQQSLWLDPAWRGLHQRDAVWRLLAARLRHGGLRFFSGLGFAGICRCCCQA